MKHIQREEFEVGDFIMATWDDTPTRVYAKGGTSYMVMRGPGHDVPQWLDFEDTLSSDEVVDKFPQFAFIYQ